jgi:hypothetical protein
MFGAKKKARGGAFNFRVSDVVEVPLRGTLLRLRLVEGSPSMGDLGPGARLRLVSPGGEAREVSIDAHAVTGGAATQERLDRTRELDVVIGDAADAVPVEIGWSATGPVDGA